MKKINKLSWLIVLIGVLAFIYLVLTSSEVATARINSITYLRQLNASFSLIGENPFKWLGFWHWNINSSETFTNSKIHLTYPIIGYLPNSLIAYITNDHVLYQKLTLTLGVSQLFLLSWIIYDLFIHSGFETKGFPKRSISFFGALAGLLLLTNPAFLGLLTEPDFEDCFIFLSIIGLWLRLRHHKKLLSNFFLVIAAYSYPTGSLVFIIGKILLNFINQKEWFGRNWRSDKETIQNKEGINMSGGVTIKPFLIGITLYLLIRYLATIMIISSGYEASGGGLLFRIGLEQSDTYYGGILSTLKFITPIANVPSGIANVDINNLSLSLIWQIINCLLLLTEFAIITAIGSIISILRVSELESCKKSSIETVSGYFVLITILYIAIFPQWAAVHFRLIARLLAPACAIGLALILMKLNRRIIDSRPTSLSWELVLLSWVLIVDQLRYFLTWNT